MTNVDFPLQFTCGWVDTETPITTMDNGIGQASLLIDICSSNLYNLSSHTSPSNKNTSTVKFNQTDSLRRLSAQAFNKALGAISQIFYLISCAFSRIQNEGSKKATLHTGTHTYIKHTAVRFATFSAMVAE